MIPITAVPISKEWATALAGGLSGFSQVCAEQPFDTIKTRLQSRNFDKMVSPSQLVRHTFKTEGLSAFFLGIAPRLATYSAVKFSLFSLYEHFLGLTNGNTFAAGAIAGGINSIISCPQEVLKAQLQMQIMSRARPIITSDAHAAASGRGYRGPMWTITHLLKRHGALIFYRGLAPLALRDTIGYGLLYTTYFGLKERYHGQIPNWLCGGVSGLFFYLSTLPIDRCKTILMTQNFDQEASRPKAKSSAALQKSAPRGAGTKVHVACIATDVSAYATGNITTSARAFWGVYNTQGITGFYRGCEPTLLRTFCGQAVALTTYDYALTTLYKEDKGTCEIE
jgi:solute carrier family 25 carnitine/acylcarnitine transporter 20/29